MTQTPIKLKKEAEFLSFLSSQTDSIAPKYKDLSIRKKAEELLKKGGLPSRRIEKCHYTDLARIIADMRFETQSLSMEEKLPAFVKDSFLLENSSPQEENIVPLLGIAESVSCLPIFDHIQSLEKASDALKEGDVIGQINALAFTRGWKIDIAADIHKPIELQTIYAQAQLHTRSFINVAEAVQATVIEREITQKSNSLNTSVVTIVVEKNATLHWIVVQNATAPALQLAQLNATIKENGRLYVYVIHTGAKFLRREVNVELVEESGDFQLRTINLLSKDDHVDLTMVVRHCAPATSSREIVRNIVADEAKGIFQGLISVEKEAQKTDAKMACNSLILSDSGHFFAKPELEIFADDVACGHGATVRDLDQDQLFYLMSRGIPKLAARALLIRAFIDELLDGLENDTVKTAIEEMLKDCIYKYA